jgi:hypothetical protein
MAAAVQPTTSCGRSENENREKESEINRLRQYRRFAPPSMRVVIYLLIILLTYQKSSKSFILIA